jgi:hypothetical protein
MAAMKLEKSMPEQVYHHVCAEQAYLGLPMCPLVILSLAREARVAVMLRSPERRMPHLVDSKGAAQWPNRIFLLNLAVRKSRRPQGRLVVGSRPPNSSVSELSVDQHN